MINYKIFIFTYFSNKYRFLDNTVSNLNWLLHITVALAQSVINLKTMMYFLKEITDYINVV